MRCHPERLLFPLLLGVAACSGPARVVPVEDRGVSVPQPQPGPQSAQDARDMQYPPAPGEQVQGASESPAVLALLDEARTMEGSGQDESAAAALERALRINPDSALLWHRLAQVRLRQARWAQAETLAQKSLALDGADGALVTGNWRLIARARHELGDAAGARAAENAAARR